MGKVKVEAWQCGRCGHTWLPRKTTEGEPTICPSCKSPYWNKPRQRNQKDNTKKEKNGGK